MRVPLRRRADPRGEFVRHGSRIHRELASRAAFPVRTDAEPHLGRGHPRRRAWSTSPTCRSAAASHGNTPARMKRSGQVGGYCAAAWPCRCCATGRSSARSRCIAASPGKFADKRGRPAADLRRPGGDRHRERAAVQRDARGAGAADRHRRGAARDQQLGRRHRAGVRQDPRQLPAPVRHRAARHLPRRRRRPGARRRVARLGARGHRAHVPQADRADDDGPRHPRAPHAAHPRHRGDARSAGRGARRRSN